MSGSNPTRLTLKLEGGSADQGRLPLPELLRVGDQVHALLRDVATVLAYRSSGQRGRGKKFIEAATELDVVAEPRPGSFVLDLELPKSSTPLDEEVEGLDLGPHLGHQALGALVPESTLSTTRPHPFRPGLTEEYCARSRSSGRR